jgi:hypothetical protein
MKVCITCKIEMSCKKTGARLVFGFSHVYACDIFECPRCGATFANGNKTAYYDPEVLNREDDHVYQINQN